MSLLLLNASSRLAQGFLRVAAESGKYERIVCADIFPTYTTVERLLKYRSTITTPTKIDLFKVSDKQDLHDIVKQCNNLLYVTHDYYQLTASKKNLLLATIEQVKNRSYKTVAYVAPVEHDHQQEIDEWKHLEVEGKRSIPQLVEIRSDITFGPTSTVINQLAHRVLTGRTIYYKPNGSSPSPIFTGDLDRIVGEVLSGKHEGKQFLAQGHKHIDFRSIIHLLEDSLGMNYKAKFNNCMIENILAPTSINLLSQQIYCPSYQNMCKLINNFKQPDNRGYDKLPLEDLQDIDKYYKENKIQTSCDGNDIVAHIVG